MFIEEDRLDAIAGHTVRFEVTEEFEKEFPFLRHGIPGFHPGQILPVVPADSHSGGERGKGTEGERGQEREDESDREPP